MALTTISIEPEDLALFKDKKRAYCAKMKKDFKDSEYFAIWVRGKD